jgi:hypothetical protein
VLLVTDIATPTDELMRTSGATLAGIAGSLGLVAAIWVAEHLRTGAGVDVAAVTLAACYATYAGVALTRGDSREIGVENAFLALGLVFVGLGLWHHSAWLALGWALHGGWDFLHRRDRHLVGVRGVPPWYVVTCMVWDPIVAVGILLIL